MKSYNMMALRGMDMDDHTFQSEMRDQGIHVPDNVLYTKELTPWVIDHIRTETPRKMVADQAINPTTNQPFTMEEAKRTCNESAAQATKNYQTLLKM